MLTIGLLVLTLLFALLALDSSRFVHSAKHRVWFMKPHSARQHNFGSWYVSEQQLFDQRDPAAWSFPGIFWVFALLTVVSAVATVASWLQQA